MTSANPWISTVVLNCGVLRVPVVHLLTRIDSQIRDLTCLWSPRGLAYRTADPLPPPGIVECRDPRRMSTVRRTRTYLLTKHDTVSTSVGRSWNSGLKPTASQAASHCPSPAVRARCWNAARAFSTFCRLAGRTSVWHATKAFKACKRRFQGAGIRDVCQQWGHHALWHLGRLTGQVS